MATLPIVVVSLLAVQVCAPATRRPNQLMSDYLARSCRIRGYNLGYRIPDSSTPFRESVMLGGLKFHQMK